MINKRYARAYKEVIEIYKCLSEDEQRKIPEEKIKFYRENMDADYNFTIDPNIEIYKQNISKEASAIIINLFLDYFADDEQRQNLREAFEIIEKMRKKQG